MILSAIPYKKPQRGRHKILLVSACFFYFLLSPLKNFASSDPDYDEILVYLNVQSIGGEEIPSIIRGNDVYLSVTDVFDFLKIRYETSATGDSIAGFFISRDTTFLLEATDHRIRFGNRDYYLPADAMIKTETALYLRTDYFGSVFGLDCTFNFRSLTVTVKSRKELPAITEMRQEQMRMNLNRVKQQFIADSVIRQGHPLFHLGAADWALNSTQQINGVNYTRFTLGLGSIIAGGEFNTVLAYASNEPFTEKQQYYLWRYVNNDLKVLRQVTAGRIAYQSISSIYEPVAGIQFTNTPTYQRRSFGTYTISDHTYPNWTVELYINNVLIDYVKADVSGFFTFDVPLMYGNTEITLRYYGPWGEEQVSRRNIYIPFTFMPANTFEYKVSGGIVEDSLHSRFAQATMNYGLSRGITIGGGVEYLSSVSNTEPMPFVSGSMKLTRGMLFSGEYVYGVRSKSMISYHLPCNLQLDVNYIHYETAQEAVKNSYTEQRKATLSLPFHIKNIGAFSRFTFNRNSFEEITFTNSDLLLSFAFPGVSMNITTYGYFMKNTDPTIYSSYSFSLLLHKGMLLTPSVRYEYTDKKILFASLELEKHIFRSGFVKLSYEYDVVNNIRYFDAGLKYDFSFGHAAFDAGSINNVTSFSESAYGSLIYNNEEKHIIPKSNMNTDRGGIILLAYLDRNNNGRRDAGEQKVIAPSVHTNGGVKEIRRDSTVMISGLEPYTDFFVELDGSNFENIAWRIPHVKLSVAIDPNRMKLVEIPVQVMGEATGNVYTRNTSGIHGAGRIKVSFYKSDSSYIASTLSEEDGYFTFMGLPPGNYFAVVDTAQMKKLQRSVLSGIIHFEIKMDDDGDVAGSLNFLVQQVPDTIQYSAPVPVLTIENHISLKPAPVLTRHSDPALQLNEKIILSGSVFNTPGEKLLLKTTVKSNTISSADASGRTIHYNFASSVLYDDKFKPVGGYELEIQLDENYFKNYGRKK